MGLLLVITLLCLMKVGMESSFAYCFMTNHMVIKTFTDAYKNTYYMKEITSSKGNIMNWFIQGTGHTILMIVRTYLCVLPHHVSIKVCNASNLAYYQRKLSKIWVAQRYTSIDWRIAWRPKVYAQWWLVCWMCLFVRSRAHCKSIWKTKLC